MNILQTVIRKQLRHIEEHIYMIHAKEFPEKNLYLYTNSTLLNKKNTRFCNKAFNNRNK